MFSPLNHQPEGISCPKKRLCVWKVSTGENFDFWKLEKDQLSIGTCFVLVLGHFIAGWLWVKRPIECDKISFPSLNCRVQRFRSLGLSLSRRVEKTYDNSSGKVLSLISDVFSDGYRKWNYLEVYIVVGGDIRPRQWLALHQELNDYWCASNVQENDTLTLQVRQNESAGNCAVRVSSNEGQPVLSPRQILYHLLSSQAMLLWIYCFRLQPISCT